MSEIKLKLPKASYLSESNEGLQIRSPISLMKQIKGPIGIHLQGFLEPKTRKILKFHPQANVSAEKLVWTLDGAILYIIITDGPPLTSGHTLGKLTLHEYSQTSLLKDYTNTTRFSLKR